MKQTIKFFIAAWISLLPALSIADYSEHPEAAAFVDTMVNKHQFDRQQILAWLSYAEHQKSIVKAMSRPAEKVKPWYEYRKHFISDLRTERGLQFWAENRQTLERAEKNLVSILQSLSALLALKPTMAAIPAATRSLMP